MPALENGRWVLCDRYTDSTEAYQGGGRNWERRRAPVHEVLCRGLWPDLTILMDSDVDHSVKRARRRNLAAVDGAHADENRFEQESHAFFKRVRDAFIAIAQREPQRVAMIDARRPAEVVHPEIVRIVRGRLLGTAEATRTQRRDQAPGLGNLMPFSDFHGNAEVVRTMREMLARDHFPHAVIFSGPQGSGKFTLAQMVAKAMNCLQPPTGDDLPTFGVCANCTRIAQADALDGRSAKFLHKFAKRSIGLCYFRQEFLSTGAAAGFFIRSTAATTQTLACSSENH